MMQKTFLTVLAVVSALLFHSCTESEQFNELSDQTQVDLTEVRPFDNVIKAAESSYAMLYGDKSRSSVKVNPAIVPVVKYGSRAGDGDTLLYVVNMMDDEGFVVLNEINDTTYHALAVSDCGNINDVDNIDNPGMKLFMDAAMNYSIENIDDMKSSNSLPLKPMFIADTIKNEFVSVNPKCKVKWGQEYPAGQFCPNGISGCVMLAGAIALSHFETPKNLTLTFPERDIDSTTLNWSLMKNTITSSEDDLGSPMAIQLGKQLGYFCREIGYRINASYFNGGTGAYTEDLRNALSSLSEDISISSFETSVPDVKSILKGLVDKVIIARGSRGSVGHAWVIDGCYYIDLEINEYYQDKNGNYTDLHVYKTKVDYQHINWGWNGKCNGYFDNGVFASANGKQYDDDSLDNSLDRNYDIGVSYFVISKAFGRPIIDQPLKPIL